MSGLCYWYCVIIIWNSVNLCDKNVDSAVYIVFFKCYYCQVVENSIILVSSMINIRGVDLQISIKTRI